MIAGEKITFFVNGIPIGGIDSASVQIDPINLALNDAEKTLIETRKFNMQEICRTFQVPAQVVSPEFFIKDIKDLRRFFEGYWVRVFKKTCTVNPNHKVYHKKHHYRRMQREFNRKP